MSQVTMKELLEAGVHFGHQTSRWNPKMRPFIFGARNGIHIIDLQQTVSLFRQACDFVREVAARGGTMLFVGTKKQAQEAIRTEALRCGQFYVNNRWLGGTLTNFQTIKQSIERMKKLEETLDDPTSQTAYKKKERLMMQREVDKLRFNLDGIRDMKRPPDLVFVIDPDREEIGVKEACRLKIPVVAVVDSNCDPGQIAYCIPGNDDAIRAIRLFCSAIADAALQGQAEREERARAVDKLDGAGDAVTLGSPMAAAQTAAAPTASVAGSVAEAAAADVASATPTASDPSTTAAASGAATGTDSSALSSAAAADTAYAVKTPAAGQAPVSSETPAAGQVPAPSETPAAGQAPASSETPAANQTSAAAETAAAASSSPAAVSEQAEATPEAQPEAPVSSPDDTAAVASEAAVADTEPKQ